jgi:hypothetical protein
MLERRIMREGRSEDGKVRFEYPRDWLVLGSRLFVASSLIAIATALLTVIDWKSWGLGSLNVIPITLIGLLGLLMCMSVLARVWSRESLLIDSNGSVLVWARSGPIRQRKKEIQFEDIRAIEVCHMDFDKPTGGSIWDVSLNISELPSLSLGCSTSELAAVALAERLSGLLHAPLQKTSPPSSPPS